MASLNLQLICVEYFRDNLELDDYMCAAMVGCMIAESLLNIKELEELEDKLKNIKDDILDGQYKNNFGKAIRKCKNLKEAVATAYCRYFNGYSSKTTPANDGDIKRIDKYYNKENNDNSNISGFSIRLKYANQVLDNYHHSIDI